MTRAGRSMTLILAFLWVLLPLSPGRAAEVSGLYEAEVAVADQSRDARAQAVRVALAGVLVKVSGNANVVLAPGVAELLNRANQFVRQFRYIQARPGDGEPEALRLWVSFDSLAVNEALSGAGQAVWGHARPSLMVWLAIDEPGTRLLLGANDEHAARGELETLSRQRAAPLVLPLLDLQDQTKLNFAEVWAGFRDNIVAASQRYGTEAVLVGRLLAGRDGFLRARWNLYQAERTWEWVSSGNLSGVLAGGVDGAVDVLAQLFARAGDTGVARLKLRVEQVADLAGYARALKYLRQLGPVEEAQPAQVLAGSVTFHVSLRGGAAGLAEAIGLGDKLVLAPLPRVAGVEPLPGEADLVYRLLQ